MTADAKPGYRAAVESAAILEGPARLQWGVSGRQPLEMLKGIVTGRMPAPPDEGFLEAHAGAATYHAVLTPKGRIIADLRLWVEPGPEGPGVRCDVAPEGADPLREHLARFLPPRLARLDDRSAESGCMTVAGPAAADLLSRVGLGLRVEARELQELAEGEFRLVSAASAEQVLVMAVDDYSVPAFDVIAAPAVLNGLRELLAGAGAGVADAEVREILRVERGRPLFGRELGPDVIPVEAGIQDRAIDHAKGCYTGQEVIVRIRDRGHVNRHLRRLQLQKESDPPEAGAPLFRGDRPVGAVTTGAQSPREGPLALAYVRREVSPGESVRVGDPEGPEARVQEVRDP